MMMFMSLFAFVMIGFVVGLTIINICNQLSVETDERIKDSYRHIDKHRAEQARAGNQLNMKLYLHGIEYYNKCQAR